MRGIYCFVLLLLLVAPIVAVQAQTQKDTPSLALFSSTWDKSTLNALIIEANNESWWKPEYTSAAQDAIEGWNQAIDYFSSKYIAYSYLSNLTLSAEVSNHYIPGYDIYVTYNRTMMKSGQIELGLDTTSTKSDGIVDHCIINLATTSESLSLNNNGVKNVATHELGHALGLGHSNSTLDLMYATNDLIFSNNAISTLDLYGVAIAFDWMRTGKTPESQARETIILPPNIAFEYAPNQKETQNPINDISKIVESVISFIERNIILSLIMIGAIIALIIGISGIRSKSRKVKRVHEGYQIACFEDIFRLTKYRLYANLTVYCLRVLKERAKAMAQISSKQPIRTVALQDILPSCS